MPSRSLLANSRRLSGSDRLRWRVGPLIDESCGKDSLCTELSPYSVDRSREEPVPVGFVGSGIMHLEQRELIGGRVDGERRKTDTDEASRNAARLAKFCQQGSRYFENY